MPNIVVNQVNLAGNLTRDPEVRFLSSGTAVARVSMAVNNRIKKGDEWVDDPCFIDVTVFGKRAEWVGENLDKGNSVFVSGRLQFRSWETDGQKRSKHEVIAENITLLSGSGAKSSGREPGADDDSYGEPGNGRRSSSKGNSRDGEVPF
jgi:single-strand DNA-binding protein